MTMAKAKAKSTAVATVDPRGATLDQLHQVAMNGFRTTLETAKQAGEILIAVKAEVGHTKFKKWIAENVHFSYETASGYKRIAENWEKITQAKMQPKAELAGAEKGIKATLRSLVTKKRNNNKDVPPTQKQIRDAMHVIWDLVDGDPMKFLIACNFSNQQFFKLPTIAKQMADERAEQKAKEFASKAKTTPVTAETQEVAEAVNAE